MLGLAVIVTAKSASSTLDYSSETWAEAVSNVYFVGDEHAVTLNQLLRSSSRFKMLE